MKDDYKRIFLSHSSADKAFVRKLAKQISRYGHKPWVDEAEIKLGDSLISKIQSGLTSCEYMGVILSPNSVESPWVEKELEVVLTEEIIEKSVKVLPILYKDCEIPKFLKGKLYADFRDPRNFEFEVRRLATVMGETWYGIVGDNPDKLIKADLVINKVDFLERLEKYFHPRKVTIDIYEDGSGVGNLKILNTDKTYELYGISTQIKNHDVLSSVFFENKDFYITDITMFYSDDLDLPCDFVGEPDNAFVMVFGLEKI